jgi:hypothetical protein
MQSIFRCGCFEIPVCQLEAGKRDLDGCFSTIGYGFFGFYRILDLDILLNSVFGDTNKQRIGPLENSSFD